MDDVLHAMDDDRSRDLKDVQYAFDTQDVFAMDMQQHRKPDAEPGPIQRLLEGQAEGADPGRVPARPGLGVGARPAAASQRRTSALLLAGS